MEKIEEIKKISSLLKDETEKKLYCIKEYNFICDKIFEKAFEFNFTVEEDDKNFYVNIKIKDEEFGIHKKSRIFEFIMKENSEKRFIYSSHHLLDVFNDLDIKYYSTNSDKLDNSLESEISDLEIIKLFAQENISTIYKIEFNDSKIKKIFDDKNKTKNNKISGLSLNAEYYYPENKDDIFNYKIFSVYPDKLEEFYYDNDTVILFLLGPKGASKSLFLLYYRRSCRTPKIPTLYINYKIFKNLNDKKKKYYFKKEMVYLFFEFNNFESFYQEHYHRLISQENNSFISNLTQFIQRLTDVYKNYFLKKILLIIDNFNEDDETLFPKMDELITLIKNNSNKIKLIISGNSNFFKKKYELFMKKKNFSDIIERQALFIYNLKLENDNEIKSLAAFNLRKNIKDKELEQVLLNEEIEYSKKFNLYGMHFSIINNGKNMELEKLLKYFHIMPFEYLKFSINEDKTFKFEFFNPIFLNAVKKCIKSEIKEKSLDFLLKNDNKDYLINGIYEEKLLTELISYNKLNLSNIGTKENNLLEVIKICELKDKIYKKTSNKIETNSPIIITQEKFTGELYDLLVLVPKKDNEEITYIAYMIQIGTNKPENKIVKIKSDFNENKKNYSSGIEKFIDNNIKIKDIELVFIFDKETQEKLVSKFTKLNECGSKYCIQNNIKFYCFSINDYGLYKPLTVEHYCKINEFGDFSKKMNWDNYKYERFRFLKENETKFINSKLKDDTIVGSWISFREHNEFPKEIDSELIYILQNQLYKFYIINGIIYTEEFEEIEENEVIERTKDNKLFNIFILNTNKNFEQLMQIKKKKII